MAKNYLILAHSQPKQLVRLVNRLSDDNSRFYIHIDAKVAILPFKKSLTLPNVVFIEQRERCIWGDISLVHATLQCMSTVVKEGRKGHCILLSGQDYPIKNNQEINAFLSKNSAFDFVDLLPVSELWPFGRWRKRVRFYKFNFSEKQNDFKIIPSVFDKAFYMPENLYFAAKYFLKGKLNLFRLFKKRKFPKYFEPFGGPQWWTLRVETVEKLLQFLDEYPDYVKYHQFSFCSDEFLLQSILQHLADKGSIQIKPGLHYVNWDRNIIAPEILTNTDFSKLVLLPEHLLFARKFNSRKDNFILDKIDNFTSKNKELKIIQMDFFLQNKALPIITPSHELITVNQHTFLNTLTPNSTVVDLGGNKGGFSKKILDFFSVKNLFIVEANPQMLPFIKKNMEGFPRKPTIISALIGPNYSASVDFHLSNDPESSLVNKSLNQTVKFIETIQVEMVSMKEIYKRIGDQTIDLLKVDIEGMEWDILEKFTTSDYEKIDQITVEFHDFLDSNMISRTEQVKAHLESLGYIYKKGNYKSNAEYYDCFFCKPHLYEKYTAQKNAKPNPAYRSLQQRYIEKEEYISWLELDKDRASRLKQTLSWKLTAPLRAIASFIGK